MRDLFRAESDILSEADYRALVVARFPEVAPDVEDFEDLTHVVTGSVERLANLLIRTGDIGRLKELYDFFAYLARHSKQLAPNVLNALHVSFLEGLELDHPVHGAAAQRLLPPVLRDMREAQLEHNRRIGWM